MRISLFLISAFLSLNTIPAMAFPSVSVDNQMVQMYDPPNEFHLFHENNAKILSYHADRNVRICDKNDRDSVGLDVKHDGTTSSVRPGACAVFTARNFVIHPAKPLNPNYDLQGTIEQKRG